MALINLNIKNFQQPNITNDMSTSLSAFNGAPVDDSNTLARSCLITLQPSTSQVNPSGGNDGWWGFSNRDLSISGVDANSSMGVGGFTGWLSYNNPYSGSINPIPTGQQDAYATTPGMPLQFTEYDPGGGGTMYYPGNFTSSYPVTMQYGNEWVTVDQTYNYRIGHDFWKYALDGTMYDAGLQMTVPYEPRFGSPGSHYKVWFNAQNTAANGGVASNLWTGNPFNNYIANWSPFVDRVVAVNSKMMIPNGYDSNNVVQWKPAQGNKVYVIVVLKDDVTGQDIIESGGFISVDLGGEPQFYEFDLLPEPEPDPGPFDGDDTLGESNNGEGDQTFNVPDDYSIEDFAAMGGTVNINLTLNAGDELTEVNIGQVFGDEGLTIDQSDFNEITNTFEIDNSSNYDDYVAEQTINEFNVAASEGDNYGLGDGGPVNLSFEEYVTNFCNDPANVLDTLCVDDSVFQQINNIFNQIGSSIGGDAEVDGGM